MKDWFTHLLVIVLVVTGAFVAIASGCQSDLRGEAGGGSCSETHFESFMPFVTASDAAAPFVRFDLLAVLIAAALTVPTMARTVPPNLLTRSFGIPKRIQLILRD